MAPKAGETRTYEIRINPAGALQDDGALVTPALVTIDRRQISVIVGPLGVERALLAAFRAHGLTDAGIGPCNTLTIDRTPVGHIVRVATPATVPAPRTDDDLTGIARAVGMTDAP